LLKQRQEGYKPRNYNLEDESVDYAKMRVGLKTMDDISVNLGSYKKINSHYGDKKFVLNAIYKHDYKTLREISNYFYESSGIYYKLCRYLAYLYRYDWYVTPYIVEGKSSNKILNDFSKVLLYLDKSDVKRVCGNLALDIVKEAVSYGLIVDFGDKFGV
jgi:ubiquinone/menaquinone biosynthesis C-methylase UbiE